MMNRQLLLMAFVLIAGCSRPDVSDFKQALDEEAQKRGVPPLPVGRSDQPKAYDAARLADPFYPKIELRRTQ